jgi:hypothetical protein
MTPSTRALLVPEVRFLWAIEVPWDQATRVEARDFSRWVQIGGKPASARWTRANRGVDDGKVGTWPEVILLLADGACVRPR